MPLFHAVVENGDAFRIFWQTRVVRVIRDGLRLAVNWAAREGADEARAVHAYRDRTGALTGSIGAITNAGSTTDDYGAEILAAQPYASYVENGTRAHVIEARRAAMLRFVNQAGQVVFRVRVNHPGSRPFPFMGPAYLKAERVLQREAEVAVAKAQELLDQ